MFIENVTERVPVWLCARSERSWDIGHIWPLLVRFEHVELKPFHPSETQKLVEAAIRQNGVPEKTLEIVDWLHRRAAGNPKILCELLTEIARGHYDLSNAHALTAVEPGPSHPRAFPDGVKWP